MELARRLRLERAAWHLTHTTRPVVDVALDAGFRIARGLHPRFVSDTTPPTGFRRRTYPRIELPARCGVHYSASGTVAAFIPVTSGGMMQVEPERYPAFDWERSAMLVPTIRFLRRSRSSDRRLVRWPAN